MKRLLSLTLAILLVLTSGLLTFAEDSNEADKVITENPYQILWQLQIFEGDYVPEKPVTRAQMADIAVGMSNLRGVGKLHEKVAFSDIEPDHTYYQSLQIAVGTGLMRGFGDDMFRPDEPILLEHCVNVVLNVLGYKSEVIGSDNALTTAARLKLMRGLGEVFGQPAALRSVCALVKNALEVNVLESNWASDTKYKVSDRTLLETCFDISTRRGIVTANYITGINAETEPASEGYLTVDDMMYLYSGTDSQELLGKNVRLYYREEKGTDPTAVYIEELNNAVAAFSGRDVTSLTRAQNLVVKYEKGSAEEKIVTVNNPAVIYNGRYTEYSQLSREEFENPASVYTYLDNTGDGIYDIVFVKKGTTVSVEKVFDDNKTLFFDYEVDINGKMASSFSFLDADKHDRLAIVKDGEETAFSKLEAGDIVTFYTAKEDDGFLTIEASSKRFEGMIGAVGDSSSELEIVIEGENYQLSTDYAAYLNTSGKQLSAGDDGIFMLDVNGNIANCELYSESDKIYGFLTGIDEGTGVDKTVRMKVFTEKNKFEILELKDKVRYIRRGIDLGRVPASLINGTFSPYYDGYENEKLLYSKSFAEYDTGTVVTNDMMGPQCIRISDGMRVEPMDGNHPNKGIFKPNATSEAVFRFDSAQGNFSNLKLIVAGRGIMGCDLNLYVGDDEQTAQRVPGEFPNDIYFEKREVNLTKYAKDKSSLYVRIEFINTRPNDTWSWLESIEAVEKVTVNQGDLIHKKATLYEKDFQGLAEGTKITQETMGTECVEISDGFVVRNKSNEMTDTQTIFRPSGTGIIRLKFDSNNPAGFEKLKFFYTGRSMDFNGGNDERLDIFAVDDAGEQSAVTSLDGYAANEPVDFSEFAAGKNTVYIQVELTNEADWNWAYLQNMRVEEEYYEPWYPEPEDNKFTKESMQLIRFKLNDNKQIVLLETAMPMEISDSFDGAVLGRNTFRQVGAKATRSYYDYGRCFGGTSSERMMANSQTLCFNVPGDPATDDAAVFYNDKNYSVGSWPERGGSYHVAFYDSDEVGFAPVMVNFGGDAKKKMEYATNYSVVDRVVQALDEDGEEITKMYAYNMQGQLLEYTPKDSESDIFRRKIDGKKFQFGDVVQFAVPGNEVEVFNTIFTTDSKNEHFGITYKDLENQVPNTLGDMPAYGNESSDLRVMTGVIKKVTPEFIQLYTGPNFDVWQTWYVHESKIALDVDMSRQKVTPLNYSALREGDFVVLRQQWSMNINIIRYTK